MNQGEIAEQGSHAELIEKKGIYHKLHALQSFQD
jgi:subfamily B ATP-binding cassette protein MsbA